MGIKLLKIAFVAATTVISFTAGAGVGACTVAYAFGKAVDFSKLRREQDEGGEKDEPEPEKEPVDAPTK